ncbi:hypothetical protein QBC41DRAFT_356704 [Cercophora samala]|uniref:Uncharacterized protein n=1 Tax=Cercophora samala TaxID=330535 RepID=A0AA39ZCB7_9PEZI|nr:hypothetical protein QBC41DRAFT_356704 [Cercophora samala]
MARVSTLLLSSLAAISCVSAQLSTNAQYAVNKTRSYFTTAIPLQSATSNIGYLSCLQYTLNQGPYTTIVPLLNTLTNTFTEGYQQIVTFQPRLNVSIPEEKAAGDDIIQSLNAASIETGGAFDKLSQPGTVNLCTIPMVGAAVKKALENLKAAARPFYLSLATYHSTEGPGIAGLLLGFTSRIDSAIQAFSSIVPV